jgi:hypothetical protein
MGLRCGGGLLSVCGFANNLRAAQMIMLVIAAHNSSQLLSSA